jgi:hypothetical protein
MLEKMIEALARKNAKNTTTNSELVAPIPTRSQPRPLAAKQERSYV